MLPTKSHPKWVPLIKGELKVNFKTVSGNMLISRIARNLSTNSSPAAVATGLDEAYSFFIKYEPIFGEEITKLFNQQ
jgi:hypothetical protein